MTAYSLQGSLNFHYAAPPRPGARMIEFIQRNRAPIEQGLAPDAEYPAIVKAFDEANEAIGVRSLSKPQGRLIGSLEGLSQQERAFVAEMLAQGKSVEMAPRGTGRTADFAQRRTPRARAAEKSAALASCADSQSVLHRDPPAATGCD
jgi:hypothetical protein